MYVVFNQNLVIIKTVYFLHRFHYCSKVWDAIKKSQFFNEYNRLQT